VIREFARNPSRGGGKRKSARTCVVVWSSRERKIRCIRSQLDGCEVSSSRGGVTKRKSERDEKNEQSTKEKDAEREEIDSGFESKRSEEIVTRVRRERKSKERS